MMEYYLLVERQASRFWKCKLVTMIYDGNHMLLVDLEFKRLKARHVRCLGEVHRGG